MNPQIKRIQSGRSSAGWSHADHVNFMQDRFGQNSLLKLTQAQRDEYEDYLRGLGHIGYGGKNSERRPAPAKETMSQEAFIKLLWDQLDVAGKLRDPTDDGLNKFVKRTVGVDQLAWCDKKAKSKIITALKNWRK